MNDRYQIVVVLVPLCAAVLCALAWGRFPWLRCAAFASACFVAALPFCLPIFDRSPHGHPDIRDAIFLIFAAPLFLIGAIVAGIGLCLRSQDRGACAAALLLDLFMLIVGLTL